MAKKKPGLADRHRNKKMVRLPDEHHELLKRLADRNRRDMTAELQIALENHLKAAGLWPPEAAD